MKNDRTSFKKGTPENAMLKLALNGAYGKSLSEHSCLLVTVLILQFLTVSHTTSTLIIDH
jgi:hypothetical protein